MKVLLKKRAESLSNQAVGVWVEPKVDTEILKNTNQRKKKYRIYY